MKVDFKITTWERVEVPEEFQAQIIKGLEDGTITSSNDIFAITDDLNDGNGGCNYSIIAEVEEQMTVEENGGCSTIEVVDCEECSFINGEL